jgi:hypothetical protein
MIRMIAAAIILTACTLPALAGEDLHIKQGMGLTASMEHIGSVLERARGHKVLTDVQTDAYLKRLAVIHATYEDISKKNGKLSYGEMQWTAKELAGLTEDINSRLVINNTPAPAITSAHLHDQFKSLQTKVSGALNVGRIDGQEAKMFRDEAKRIIASAKQNDEKSLHDASRALNRLNSRLQIASARSRSANLGNNFAFGPRAF